MRPIKFRAWDIIAKRYFFLNDSLSSIPYYELFCHTPDNRPYKLEQFTGLLDRLGKEIYEGDIVYDEEFDYKSEVVFGKIGYDGVWNGLTGFALANQDYGSFFELDYYFDPTKLEVVGNVHEKQGSDVSEKKKG